MKARSFLSYLSSTAVMLLVGLCSTTPSFPAQQPSAGTTPVSVVVSAEAKRGNEVPHVSREDVRVMAGRNRLQITGWVPYQGNQAGLELMVLIDELSNPSLSINYDDLQRFFAAQPATTAIAVGYMENGSARMVQQFTTDRSAADKALRIPIGMAAGASSPYLAVAEAIKRWPDSDNRHVIFMISSGFDPMQPGTQDTYLQNAITQAQKTGTQVYAIYAEGSSHFSHSFWRTNQAQSNLSQLADQTGGESYFQGTKTPISFTPFLEQFAARLNHQYKLTFLAPAGKKSSHLQIQVQTEVPNVELVTAGSVFVPAQN
jgi:VWFA-related protein